MFIKITRSKNHCYLQIVHSYRDGEKIKHKVCANLGRFDQLIDNPQLVRLGERFLEIAGRSPSPPCKIEELDRLVYGHFVYQKLWMKWNLPSLLQRLLMNRRIRFDFVNTVFLLLIDRLLKPQSKLKCFEKQDRYADMNKIELHHIYRSLDLLCEGKKFIEESLFDRRRDLFNYMVDIVFYDVTTFHFESVVADDLRDFGFSKNAKFNEVQVVLGLLVDSYGVPVGFDLFPGNTYEGDTLLKAIEKLKNRFAIGEVIIVTDKGMSNMQNFFRIRDAGYDYIISMRLKSFSKSLQEKILREEGYQDLKHEEDGKFRYKIIREYPQTMLNEQKEKCTEKVNLVCYWSEKRARKDRADRERMLKKAKANLEKGKGINDKRGYRRYIIMDGEKKAVGVDMERFEYDARFDGYYVIESSYPKLTASQVLTEYKKLWRIENTFRVMKSSLWTRPIFVWTPRRIVGHFVLCFIALLLERTLEQKLREKKITLSPEKIKEALNSLQLSLIEMDGNSYYLKGKVEKPASSILRAMRIKQPPNLLPADQFKM
jgi:transposase